jgi:uncharacterized membrane protein YphA (DoxX/SURF4 family)
MSLLANETRRYCATLVDRFGRGWNRFWFAPSDPAPLGVVRIATGCLALYWLISLSPDLTTFFGPQGLLPIGLQETLFGTENFRPSYYNYLDSPAQLWAAHLIGVAIVAAFTAGLFTRATSILALVVVLATIHRAPQITGQFEPVLTMLMFYLCLGPCGGRYSLDALRRRRADSDGQTVESAAREWRSTWATISVRLIQVHLSVIYLMMGIGKLADPTGVWWMGEAMWWLARPDSRLVDFSWLADHPYVLNAWTHAQVLFELGFGVLIWNRLARPLLLAAAVPMWTLVALASGWTPFCLLMLSANLAFVSPRLLTAVLARRTPAAEAPAQAASECVV